MIKMIMMFMFRKDITSRFLSGLVAINKPNNLSNIPCNHWRRTQTEIIKKKKQARILIISKTCLRAA